MLTKSLYKHNRIKEEILFQYNMKTVEIVIEIKSKLDKIFLSAYELDFELKLNFTAESDVTKSCK